jgi:hypothetical protein
MAEMKKSEGMTASDLMDARIREITTTEPVAWPYPEKAMLVPMDTAHAPKTIIESAKAGQPMVLFFPDGEEVVLTPSKPS